MDQLIAEAKAQISKVVDILKDDLSTIRTGRATPSLIEKISVSVYESRMPLIELATITSPDAQSLLVQPFDRTIIKAIAKAIRESDLNLNPIIDNHLIRINIPPLTQNRRTELARLVGQKLESARQLARETRTQFKQKIDELKGQPGVSEDDIFRLYDELQKVYEELLEKLKTIAQEKKDKIINF